MTKGRDSSQLDMASGLVTGRWQLTTQLIHGLVSQNRAFSHLASTTSLPPRVWFDERGHRQHIHRSVLARVVDSERNF